MTKEEYEAIVGREVNDTEYCDANAVYESMFSSQSAFAKAWDDIDELRSMVCDTYRELRAHAESLQLARAEVDMHKRNKEVAAQKILNLGCKNLLSKEEIDSLARFLMGTKPYLLFKLGGTYHLSEEDRKDIIELIELK